MNCMPNLLDNKEEIYNTDLKFEAITKYFKYRTIFLM